MFLAAAFSALLASPALAETCSDQIDLLNVLLVENGNTLDADKLSQIVDCRDKAVVELNEGEEERYLARAELALSLLSQ
ncbi:MAG: hypothetical protein P8Q36_11705 [Alphaproteobacteria bacterium]|nr:hypothetical protein [Rhodospirillaceae bacterium]MDG2481515.1 hypothetical protein [Alphaproteobacteria bacterium]MBT6202507.1 hypothetical protein [Rhodospirillaceae bacterium]MBT6511076.1 hypothetical protein [Rhodospirillaceae bacterium]MBT7614590.1 hypothetical protein [Rhodospirillaceae bacterium]